MRRACGAEWSHGDSLTSIILPALLCDHSQQVTVQGTSGHRFGQRNPMNTQLTNQLLINEVSVSTRVDKTGQNLGSLRQKKFGKKQRTEEEVLKEDVLTSNSSPTDELPLLVDNWKGNGLACHSKGRVFPCGAAPAPRESDLCSPPAWAPHHWARGL